MLRDRVGVLDRTLQCPASSLAGEGGASWPDSDEALEWLGVGEMPRMMPFEPKPEMCVLSQVVGSNGKKALLLCESLQIHGLSSSRYESRMGALRKCLQETKGLVAGYTRIVLLMAHPAR